MSRTLGAYALGPVLGEGGMGVVVRATHRPTGTPVAVKLLRRIPGVPQAELLHEVRAMARLDHPNVAAVLDFGVVPDEGGPEGSEGGTWYAMELASGGTLETPGAAPTRWTELANALRALLAALAHCHARGVVHRDLKPSNVLRCGPGDLRTGPLLADFGIALTREARPVGSPSGGTRTWLAPEQLSGDWGAIGPRTDLYVVGALARRLAPAIGDAPPGLVAWTRQLMDLDPFARFACAAQAADALDRVDGREPTDRAATWRRATWPKAPVGLLGAGLALFDLRTPRYVGRTEERTAAWEVLREAAAGPRAVVVRGPGGTGLTAFAGWLSETADEEGVAVRVAIRPGAGSLVGALVFELLRLQRPDPRAVDQRLHDLRGVLGRPLVDRIREGFSTGWPVDRAGFALAHALLARWGRGRPVVLEVTDAHASPDTLRFTRWLLDVGEACCIVVLDLATDRLAPADLELAEGVQRHPRAHAVTLAPSPAEAERAMAEMLPLGARTLGPLVERTGGNLSLARTTLSSWIRDGRLARADEVWELDGPAPTAAERPYEELAIALAERSGDAAHALSALAVAALLGPRIDLGVWHRACEPELTAAGLTTRSALLELLLDRGLADETPNGFVLVQPRLSAAATRLSEASLPDLHRRCARALADATGDEERLAAAAHTLAAGDLGRAVPDLFALLDRFVAARRSADAARALAHLERVIGPDDPRHGELALHRVLLLSRAGRVDEAARHARATARWAERRDDAAVCARAEVALGGALRLSQQPDEARAVLERAILRSAGRDGATEARARTELAHLRFEAGDPAGAVDELDRAFRVAEEAGARVQAADTLRARATFDLLKGRPSDAAGRLRACIARLEAADPTAVGIGDSWGALGDAERALGRPAEAERCYRNAVERLVATGGALAQLQYVNLAVLALEQDRVDDALLALGEAWERLGPASGGVDVLVDLLTATCAAVKGDASEWERRIGRFSATWAHSPICWQPDAIALLERARTAAEARGEAGAAARAAELADGIRGRLS